ncbi:MAG: HAMP domain-containing protein [Planctomycetes bacterium]|nr:HAMP domain-containing protein [Planctomycetota bacterium]
MTLTNRLSLFFLAALAAVLIAFSAALYLLADRHLHRQLDDRLAAAARTLASAAEVEPDGVEWEPHNHPTTLAPGTFGDQFHWTVTDEAGRVIDRSAQPGAAELLTEADHGFRDGHRNPRRVDHAGRAWQAVRLRLERENPPPGPVKPGKHHAFDVTAAVPLEPVHDTLRALAAALVGLTLVVLAAALFAGRAVCRRALAPVAHMAETARSMGAADLTHRLPAPPSADELTDLAAAFNGLLDRLAEAFERERRFAGEASHQLRTPLAALIGQVEVALRRDRDSAEYRRTLTAVLDQAGRLRRVVEALLFLARSEADARLPGVERVDLAAWVPGRLRDRADGPRAGELVFEPFAAEVPALVHPDLFGELLDALLDNALKYSAPGTPIAVRVGRDPAGVWAEVEDRGCGIAQDDLPHLFRPFFRSETARRRGVPGAGLGLAVAARIAAALDGSITAESEPGRGSRFRVRLPAAPASTGEDGRAESGSEPAPTGGSVQFSYDPGER